MDFDFFRATAFSVEDLLRALERTFGSLERLSADHDTLCIRLSGVSTSFFRYPYRQIENPERTLWGFGLATDSDVAAMKMEAIAGRGSRKDFVDMRVLCRAGLTIEAAFDLFERKYGTRRTERYHRLRALAYFDLII